MLQMPQAGNIGLQSVINKLSNLIIQWGVNSTDSDGAARITTPITFLNNQWKCVALHIGKGAGVCYEDSGFKSANWIPIRIQNISGSTGGGWDLEWIGIGY